MLGGAESKACRGNEEQTVQTLIDVVILSLLFSLEFHVLNSSWQSPSSSPACFPGPVISLLSFLTFFLSSETIPAGLMFPALHFPILTPYLHISLVLQDREHPPDLP